MRNFKWLNIILILLVLTSGCGKKENVDKVKEMKQTNYQQPVLKEELNFEINEKTLISDLLASDNKVGLINGQDLLDTSSLGEKDIVIKYKENDEEKKQTVKVMIIDTAKPVIEANNELRTTVGKDLDLLKNVKAYDNSLEDIKVTIEGDYDFNKVGTYKLKYVAVDSSNNKVEEEFVLNVTKKVTTSSSGSNSSKKPALNNNTSTNNNTGSNNNSSNQNNTDDKTEENDRTASKLITSATHKYQYNYTFKYVKKTDNFDAKNKQDILNIFYTALNEGADNFNFYCSYSNCIKDFEKLISENTMSYIQDFIHPYNTFKSMMYTMSNDFITVKITKTYSNSDINKLESKVNSIINSKVTSSLSLADKIKVLHDYLVENTSYQNNGSVAQQTALGPLINGKSVCEGYSHAMSIFLYKLKVPNCRVSVPGVHMWNLAYVGGVWKHIDVTWDDPIAYNGDKRTEILRHDFFLIGSSAIKSQDQKNEHAFNKNIFKEA